jgi:hypothetical protein
MQTIMMLVGLLSASPDSAPVLHANRAATPPRIDGFLEPIWQTADSAKHFVQRYPHDGKPATDSTVAFVLFDAANLYVAFKCYARPDRLNLQVVARDNCAGDNVGLLLDTFDDKTSGYYFCVNAKGVQYDSRISSDAVDCDDSWDGIWFSDARVTEYGYCVEMRIPFKAIRYKPGLTEWYLNFDRYVPCNDEQSDWSPQRNRVFRVSSCRHMEGIEPHSRGLNLEIYPVGLVRYDTSADAAGARTVSPDAGLDVVWHPGSASSLQATVNPDFAQIEADPTQITLGRYEIWLNERRPFFLEGSDVFKLGSSGATLFYSRRIGKPLPNGGAVPILGGLKGISKFERFEAGALTTVCQETTFAAYDTLDVPRDTAWLSYYSAARLKRDVLRNSSVGFLLADKENRLVNNRAIGTDVAWRQGDVTVTGDLSFAQYQNQAAAILNRSLAGGADFRWRSRVYGALATYRNVPHDFDVRGIGYAPAKQEQGIVAVYGAYRNLGVLRAVTPFVYAFLGRDNDDTLHRYYTPSGMVELNLKFTNNWGGSVSASGQPVREYVYDPDHSPPLDTVFSYRSLSPSLYFWSDPAMPLTIDGSFWGTTRAYDYLHHWFGANATFYGDIGWRITPSISIGSSIEDIVEFDTLNRLAYQNWIITPSFHYAITRDLQVRLSGEYVPSDSTARATVLLSWNLKPKSWLYLTWTERRNTGPGLPMLDRVGAVKLRYLFYF